MTHFVEKSSRHKGAIVDINLLKRLDKAIPQWKMDLAEHEPHMVLCTDGKEHPFCLLCGEQLDIPANKQFWTIDKPVKSIKRLRD